MTHLMGAAKLLGEIFTCKLSFGDHVDFVLTVCSQRVYLLKLLRSLGLPIPQLHTVFGLDIVSDYLYTPSMVRAAYQTSTKRMDACLKLSRKFGFCDENYTKAK